MVTLDWSRWAAEMDVPPLHKRAATPTAAQRPPIRAAVD
eukprot:CAMPEP_0177238950 /NCGR_PEP_ID=MMETSP0367-20130122/46845_1 /TAXON_ID=447022 ORGANISM="Scrippsiella hangoei-like, Strain SHHI-4" /NCGR_SAMPLE_ID=MMETSP0367 /ASSEMBLY_ACC=CAM_ASM_000362 /LENGTH=38 /DNA_ID= /DNA_START= /DNA_END= /DNA_ORIENTATION=